MEANEVGEMALAVQPFGTGRATWTWVAGAVPQLVKSAVAVACRPVSRASGAVTVRPVCGRASALPVAHGRTRSKAAPWAGTEAAMVSPEDRVTSCVHRLSSRYEEDAVRPAVPGATETFCA